MTIQERIKILIARIKERKKSGYETTAIEALEELLHEVGEHKHIFGEPQKVYISRGGMGASVLMKVCKECGIRQEIK